ncbi:MAG TPA: kelch repeat-containing protein [Blastocatellia bacterium]|nr:kelch repeat-containing protein [Blastocatellia bacterium]
MIPPNKQQNNARRRSGLVLALVGLLSVTGLVKGPTTLASAQADAPSWRYTGSLNTARSGYTATLLPSGKVLVTGGYNYADFALARAELYDPAIGTWSYTASPNEPRWLHTATRLKDGKVLIVGGLGLDGSDLSARNGAELYDPDTRTWRATGSLNAPRFGHTATLLENGKVLVAAGSDVPDSPFDEPVLVDTAELYDPESGTWSFTDNFNAVYENNSTTLLQNGKVLRLSFGGWSQLYDPDTGTWSSVGKLGANIGSGHTATLLPNGKVLIVGGLIYAESSSAYLYDPDTGSWSSTGNLNRARSSHTATLLPDGKVLVAGGDGLRVFGGITRRDSLDSSELYDPYTGKWSFTSNLNTPRSEHTVTLLHDGKALLVGGGLPSAELGYNFAAVAFPRPAITMASVKGKKLIITGENFHAGAVILINGEEQGTRNDDENSKTRLIGRKAGREIKPGDRVQVRNADTTLSEEFIFTGS